MSQAPVDFSANNGVISLLDCIRIARQRIGQLLAILLVGVVITVAFSFLVKPKQNYQEVIQSARIYKSSDSPTLLSLKSMELNLQKAYSIKVSEAYCIGGPGCLGLAFDFRFSDKTGLAKLKAKTQTMLTYIQASQAKDLSYSILRLDQAVLALSAEAKNLKELIHSVDQIKQNSPAILAKLGGGLEIQSPWYEGVQLKQRLVVVNNSIDSLNLLKKEVGPARVLTSSITQRPPKFLIIWVAGFILSLILAFAWVFFAEAWVRSY